MKVYLYYEHNNEALSEDMSTICNMHIFSDAQAAKDQTLITYMNNAEYALWNDCDEKFEENKTLDDILSDFPENTQMLDITLVNVSDETLSFDIIIKEVEIEDVNNHYYNTNCGDCNTGDNNTGNYNMGNYNTGYYNIGSDNTGHKNRGYHNTGDANCGICNTGHFNQGERNTGDFNKTNNSNGCFNTKEPTITMFNKPCDWTYLNWCTSKAHGILHRVGAETTEWIYSDNMTNEEKAEHPDYKEKGGYLKECDAPENNQAWWDSLTDEEKDVIKALPNFDKNIFEEIMKVHID